MELSRLTQNDQENNTDRPISVTSSSTATSSAIKYKSILKHHHSSCSNQAKEALQTSSSRRASAGYGTRQSGNNNNNNQQQLLDNESNLSILNESDSVSCIMSMRQANKENRPYSIKYDAVADSDLFNSSNSNLSANSFNNNISSPSSNHQHFSPRSSMKIKVIDENDTNDTDN